MKVFQLERRLRTTGGLSVRDITEDVLEAVHESGVTEGIACVYSPHTTCCVRVNEFETGFLDDFANLLKRLIPTDAYYAHDDWDRRTENICPEDMDFFLALPLSDSTIDTTHEVGSHKSERQNQ